MNIIIKKSNNIGVIASSICLVHCLSTPVIFVTQLCTDSCCENSPIWWKWVDSIFLIISFFAVYHSSKLTSKKWIAISLWISWFFLLFIILNERLLILNLPHESIYLPSLSLIFLHLYNRKFCQCDMNKCCANN